MNDTLNLYQKLLKLVNMAGVLQKNKSGYNYRYVTEDEIQAKVTAGMAKYGLMLIPSVTAGSLHVIPYSYTKEKVDKKTKEKESTLCNEIIVHADMVYRWINTDNPEDSVDVPWVLIGQMEDAAQAFGAGLTYTNRYFLLKSLQIATTEADPDEYRSKQKEAENYEENEAAKAAAEALENAIADISAKGGELIKAGISKDTMYGVIAKYNNGDSDRNSIATLEVAAAIMKEFEQMLAEKKSNKKTTKKENA